MFQGSLSLAPLGSRISNKKGGCLKEGIQHFIPGGNPLYITEML